MKSKNWLFIIIMLFFCNAVFSFTPKREAFIVWNYTNKNIIVEREFLDIIGGGIQENNYFFEKNVYDMTLSICDILGVVNNNVVKPNQYLMIINYFPLGPQLNEKYNKLYALPFIDKMKIIFKRLEIKYDGNSIITLNNLDKMAIKRWDRTYILEIFDNAHGKNTTSENIDVNAASMENNSDFFQNILSVFEAISLPDGKIFVLETIPGYTPKERQTLITHAIEHQAQFQNGDSQQVFQQLLREASLFFQGVNVFRTRNPPHWYLEYDAQKVQNNALKILWN